MVIRLIVVSLIPSVNVDELELMTVVDAFHYGVCFNLQLSWEGRE